MSPRSITNDLIVETPLLRAAETIEVAVTRMLPSGLPALPVVDDGERLCGIFGEREFMTALFPGYVRELGYAGFVSGQLDEVLEKRAACGQESVRAHMNTEHIDVSEDYSDIQVAETFIHHRVLILPVTRDRKVLGVITRKDFFERLVKRFLAAG